MEHKQIAATAHTRTPSVNSRVLRSIQSENETLRSELLQAKQRTAQLQRQLSDLRTASDKVVQEVTISCKEQVHALEERCRLLADRLVGCKREEQVAETARVGFLLRWQIEERRFLARGLEAMQEVLVGIGGGVSSVPKRSPPRTGASTRSADGRYEGEIQTGDLYRLMMCVSDALQVHIASTKLEKAHIRLTLEQAASLLNELHDAVKDATRTVFDAVAQLGATSEHGSTLLLGGGAISPSSLLAAPNSALSASAQSGSGLGSLHRRGGGDDGNTAGTADVAPTVRSQDATASLFFHSLAAPLTAEQLSLKLEWVCDVLKASMRCAGEVGTFITAAMEGLKTLPPLFQQYCKEGDRASISKQPHPLMSSASPEMDALLRSFLGDLSKIKQQAAQQQDEMARQLAQEMDRHFQSTEQYERRVKLLEAECARLLRYVERQSTQGPGVGSMTQTPVRGNTRASMTLMPAPLPLHDIPVTPERYVPNSDAPKRSEPRSSRLWQERSVTASRVFPYDQRAPSEAVGPKAQREPVEVVLAAQAGDGTRVVDPAHANHNALHPSSLPGSYVNGPSSSLQLSSAAARTPVFQVASELKAMGQDSRVRPPHGASDALLSPRDAGHRFSSPASPHVSRKASTTVSASSAPAHSRLSGRRSTTASTLPQPRGTETFFTRSSTATVSPVLSTPENSSPVLRDSATEALVPSYQRTRAATAHLPFPKPPVAVTAVPALRDATTLSDVSVATSRPGRGGNPRNAPSPQPLYDEAAADIFFVDSSFGGAASSVSSVQRLRLENSRMSDIGSTAELRTLSPRQPVKLRPYVKPPLLVEGGAPRTGQQRCTPPTDASAVLSTHVAGEVSVVDTSRQEEAPNTPPIWRRIKEEVFFQRGMSSSPIVGDEASALFSTPPEVSCSYS